MNTIKLNSIGDSPVVVKKGSQVQSQEKTVEITENGTTEVVPDSGFSLSKVTVNTNVESSGSATNENDVNFRDYDGTLLYSYSWDEAVAMTALPPLPKRGGLICQGWNYTLEDIKNQGGSCEIGANYITDDGKTRLYFRKNFRGEATITLSFFLQSGDVLIDWGDGSPIEVSSDNGAKNISHTYSIYGNFKITIDASNSTGISVGSNGRGIINQNLNNLNKAEIPVYNMLYRVEMGTKFDLAQYCFNNCMSLECISLPNDNIIKRLSSCFDKCYSLKYLAIPNFFDSSFSVQNCKSLSNISMSPKISTLYGFALNYCSSLSKVTIPASLNLINGNAFQYCEGVAVYDFSAAKNIPTLSGSSAFYSISSSCKIIVPDVLYDDWIVATNWSTYADHIVKASEYTETQEA